jgi:Outer membrane lipoprotein-sorting protein
MLQKTKLMTFAVLLILLPLVLSAQQNPTGEQIIKDVYERDTPEDQTGSLTMILENSRGDQRVREIDQFIKDFGDEEKKIMFFTAPADVRNTSFMSWSYDREGKDDDQWIYLPALKKVKRISSSGSSDYFMGSDFTYDDLGARHPSEDTHTLLRQETLDGEQCYVVESVSKDRDYIYSRTISWVIVDKLVGLKKEFYDEDDDLLKTLMVKEFEKIDGFWMVLLSEMHNVQKDHTTIMELDNLELDSGVQDRIFTERIMTRGL